MLQVVIWMSGVDSSCRKITTWMSDVSSPCLTSAANCLSVHWSLVVRTPLCMPLLRVAAEPNLMLTTEACRLKNSTDAAMTAPAVNSY